MNITLISSNSFPHCTQAYFFEIDLVNASKINLEYKMRTTETYNKSNLHLFPQTGSTRKQLLCDRIGKIFQRQKYGSKMKTYLTDI